MTNQPHNPSRKTYTAAERAWNSLLLLIGALFILDIVVRIWLYQIPSLPFTPPPNERTRALATVEALTHQVEALQTQIRAHARPILAVADEDLQTYASFLQQPHTGIFRLMPSDSRTTYLLGTTQYSFIEQSTTGDRDIILRAGQFETAFAGRDAGLFVALTEDTLDAIIIEHPQVQALIQLAPETQDIYERASTLWKSREQTINGTNYDRIIPALVNTTYLLRSIMPSDNTDIVVVFRVIRQDSDKSLTILWKLLKESRIPGTS